MIPQQDTTPPYRSPSVSGPHVHIHGETCPLCEQEIPPEKFEEINGKIVSRQNEHDRAIRATLENQYAIDKAQAEAKASEALGLLRQQSKAREDLAREEARKLAEAAANEKLAAAEQTRQALQTSLREQTEQAAAAKTDAEKSRADLLDQLNIMQQENAAALAAAKTEAASREMQIRAEAVEVANKAVADKLAAQEAARQKAEGELLAKLTAADETRIAAEQQGAALKEQLANLEKAKESEVAKLREAAVIEAAWIKKEATDAAQAAVIQQLADKDGTIAAEKVKATEAENKINLLTSQHETALLQSLGAQREVLENAKEEAVNAEKAKFFAENLKLSTKVSELQRDLEKKSNEELGEGAEIDLYEALKKEYPDDDIKRVAKGEPGADIIHVVIHNRKACGKIVYDSKNHKTFRTDHVTKLRRDQLAEQAEHAVLSLHKFPAGSRQLHQQDGVLLANPARVAAVVAILREQLIRVHVLRVSAAERENKTVALYDYITSDRFSQLLKRVESQADELLGLQEKEMKQHKAAWAKQGELLRSIQKTKGDLAGEVSRIIGTDVEADEADELEEFAKEIS